MSIRFECPECQSVLKIKDALAGTDGKCPKCKTPFVVPAASAEADSPTVGGDTSPGAVESATTTNPTKPKERPKVKSPPSADDDFDPVAFLMDGGGPPKKSAKPSASPSRGAPSGPSGGLSLDDSEPSPTPRSRPKSTESPPAATAAASANSMLSASSNAKDLLTRTVEESRARAAEMPDESSRVPFFDSAELRMLLFTKILPYGGGTIVICALLYWLMGGTGDNVDLPQELIRAEGVVLINGEPTGDVMVSMRPAPDGSEKRWRASIAVTNEDGEFEMMFLEGYPGIVPGRQNVSLSYIVNGLETINTEYHDPGTVMTFDEASYDIKLESTAVIREPQQAPPAEEN